jgi:hypothetical protein
LFRLKIASSGRGALAGTRWAHLNCKKQGDGGISRCKRSLRRPTSQKSIDQPKLIEKTVTYQFLSPLMGKHREHPQRRPRVGR